MGERHGWLFEPTSNRSIHLRQAEPRITSDAGALLLREVDHRLGLTADLAAGLYDPRCPNRRRYEQVELLRQHLYGQALGYAHQDDQDALAHDVGMKLAVWDRPGRQVIDERLASQPSDWRLANRLSSKAHRRVVNEALPVWVGRHQRAAGGGRKVVRGTLDIDPFPVPVHGRQEGGAYHGYYRQTMYYPLVASFGAGGDYDAAGPGSCWSTTAGGVPRPAGDRDRGRADGWPRPAMPISAWSCGNEWADNPASGPPPRRWG